MKQIDLRQDFKTENLTLINFVFLTGEEKEMVRNWRNNENIRKWMYTDHAISQEEHFRFSENLKKDDRNYYWLVKDGNEYIGVLYFNRVDFENESSYLGIYSNPCSEIKGKGKMLRNALMELAFQTANFHTMKLEVLEDNDRAIYLYNKAGFVEEGRLREIVFKDDRWRDVVVMGMINGRERTSNGY